MSKNSILKRSHYEDFLVHAYFGLSGPGPDYLRGCINKAYLDFSRTLHGLGKLTSKDVLRERATNKLRQIFCDLKGSRTKIANQPEFDTWHKATYRHLFAIYGEYGYHHLHVGQAQKWINMTFKYIFALGDDRVSGFGGVYQFCHAPLDNILIDRLKKYGFPQLPCAWSRLDNYDEYLAYQQWIRKHFALVPLDAEFLLWLGKEKGIDNAIAA